MPDDLFSIPPAPPPAPFDFAMVLTEALFAAKREKTVKGEALTKGDLIRIIREQDALRLDKPAPRKVPRKVKLATDEEWLAALEKEPALAGLDVRKELGIAQFWCKNRHRVCTRQFFENWLMRASKEVRVNGDGQSSVRKHELMRDPRHEPAAWVNAAKRAFPGSWESVSKVAWLQLPEDMRRDILKHL